MIHDMQDMPVALGDTIIFSTARGLRIAKLLKVTEVSKFSGSYVSTITVETYAPRIKRYAIPYDSKKIYRLP